jgi:hypothetical protein
MHAVLAVDMKKLPQHSPVGYTLCCTGTYECREAQATAMDGGR